MNKRGITLALLSLAVLLGGCSVGNVDMSSHQAPAKKSSSTASQRASAKRQSTAKAKKERQQQLGTKAKYGLPQGPSWLEVYENGKATGAYLSPTKQNVVTLHERSNFTLAGQLPWLGTIKSHAFYVAHEAQDATMDQSAAFKYNLAPDLFATTQGFYNLGKVEAKVLAKHAFQDLKQFYQAVDDRNAAELPGHSDYLKALWGSTGTVADSGDLKTRYTVEEQYFNRDSINVDPDSNGADEATYVEIAFDHNDNLDRIYPTRLHIQTYVKMKETEAAKRLEGGMTNQNYGKSTTSIIEYNVIYQLTNQGQWELREVEEGSSSQYALDQSQGDWLTEKD
ncbi:hypothetical protein [Lacticaseibacillus suibinensis]|uniref:hypothetical protein n=1 Tax=Lacticaseibacillus suibinensis TaxID=2486011 RepID=UPI000F775C8D|nr:hypothetical protein [Lacticaseibacillus suibinensis]